MAAKKIRDIAVKAGEYQDRDGNTKGMWLNVGALMRGDDGNEFIILKRWFSPAGISSDRESIILSCFKSNGENNNGGGQSRGGGGSSAPAMDDEIPF